MEKSVLLQLYYFRLMVSNTLAPSHMWLADIYFVANQHFYNLNYYFQNESREDMYELFKQVFF
jgi:hypothetical protein